MILKVMNAVAYYGRNRYPIDLNGANAEFLELDSDNYMPAVLRAMACVSNECGGVPLGGKPVAIEGWKTDARLQFNVDGTYACLTGSGFTVEFGKKPTSPALPAPKDEFDYLAAVDAYVKNCLGGDCIEIPFVVQTTQYGGGWKDPVITSYAEYRAQQERSK